MNSVKQVPAWFWLLIVGAMALKAATTAFGTAGAESMTTLDDVGASPTAVARPGAPMSGFATLVPCSLAAPFLALTLCRWRYWAHSEANILRPPAAPVVQAPSDEPAPSARRGRRASHRPLPSLPPGIKPRAVAPSNAPLAPESPVTPAPQTGR